MIDSLIKLVESKIDEVNTAALGKITKVDLSKLRCNVKLKHRIQGNEIELFDVPVAVPKFHDSSIIVAPKEGDIVLVVFSKYELEEQLKNKDIVDVNELLKFNINNAVILFGIYTMVDEIPSELDEEVILIRHKSGNYILLDKDENILTKHKSGSFIKIDSSGNMTVQHSGGNSITVNASQVTLKASTIYIDGDLDFKTIRGVNAGDGVWHKH